ncbi:MAG: NAD(P)H-dependent oxidoreductase [Nannocystales bacterium]
MKVLRTDASARHRGSNSRAWADAIVETLGRTHEVQLTRRDLSDSIPQLDEATLRRFGYVSGTAEETAASELSERLMDSEVDSATPYLRHVLGFLDLHDLRILNACGSGRSEAQICEDVARLVAGSSVAV